MTIRYLRINGDVLSSLQRPEDIAAARGSFPLAELLEVHTKTTETLDVMASARRGRRRAWKDVFRGARLRQTAGHRLTTPPEAPGALASGAACCASSIIGASGGGSQAPEDDAPGSPPDMFSSAPEPPAPVAARSPAPSPGASPAPAAKKGTMMAGVLTGPHQAEWAWPPLIKGRHVRGKCDFVLVAVQHVAVPGDLVRQRDT